MVQINMKDNKKGLFTGWNQVFNFTAVQNIKGKGFKTSTILISLIIAVIFALIPVVDNAMQEDSNVDEIVETYGGIVDEQGNYNFNTIKKVYLLNETKYSNENMKLYLNATEKKLNGIDEIKVIDSITSEITNETDAVVINAKENTNSILLYVLSSQNTTVDTNEADVLGILLVSDTSFAAYGCGKFSNEQLEYLGMPTYVETANDSEDSLGEMLAKFIVPMIVALLVYMVVLIHGQAISKAIVADKSSKLMEMLLTSVRPYAIITGKVLGVSAVALGQVFIWIIAGIVGFFVGDAIVGTMNPDYINIILEIINMIKEESDGLGFSAIAIIISIVSFALGFLMYAVFAGLSGALVNKVEDLSAASAVFQLPVVVAFMVAYMTSMISFLEGTTSVWVDVVRICPLTSPFVLPADILLGTMPLSQALLAVGLLFVSCLVMIIVTGKIYKGKLFNKK